MGMAVSTVNKMLRHDLPDLRPKERLLAGDSMSLYVARLLPQVEEVPLRGHALAGLDARARLSPRATTRDQYTTSPFSYLP